MTIPNKDMVQDTVKIIAIATDIGQYYLYSKWNQLYRAIINGLPVVKSFCDEWYVSQGKPEIIQITLPVETVNRRYELTDATLRSDKILLIYAEDTVTYYNDDTYCREWRDEYIGLQSLYKLKWDTLPQQLQEIKFTLDTIMRIKDIDCELLSYSIDNGGQIVNLTEKDVQYQLLDRLIFPSPVLPQMLCKYNSKQSYDIVRQYIKIHINLEYAEITSDYNFCFTVKKRLLLTEPEIYHVDVNFGKRKPKLEKRYRKHRLVEIFEMTYSPENYKGYTPIQEFVGDNLIDLRSKIDVYCEELITFINQPLTDCPSCDGFGVIWEGKFNDDRK